LRRKGGHLQEGTGKREKGGPQTQKLHEPEKVGKD